MDRLDITERKGWPQIVEGQGFPFHSFGQRPSSENGVSAGTYWYESAYYRLTLDEVNQLERATEELHRLCLGAVDHVVRRPDKMLQLGIKSEFHGMVRASWERGDPALYGRFDLAYDGGAPKLLEYNADTPTTLVESSLIQWFWLQDQFHKKGQAKTDQFNSIHEKLIDRFRLLYGTMTPGKSMYFSAVKENIEEFATVEYLRDVATQAGMSTAFIYLEDVGWSDSLNQFVDVDDNPIDYWFKLYPYEWLVDEEFGVHLPKAHASTGVLEPPWKMVLSNKGLLPILWELYPEHENLLPAFWEYDARLGDSFVAKPMYGREGGNIVLESPELRLNMPGPYDKVRKVFQQYQRLPKFGEQYMTLGSWVIGDKSAGICIREDEKPIIVNTSRLVPHMFVN